MFKNNLIYCTKNCKINFNLIEQTSLQQKNSLIVSARIKNFKYNLLIKLC